MFSALARFTERYRIAIIAVWLALAAVLVIFAPSLSKVGITDDSQFLPRDTESIHAQDIIKTRFTGAVVQPAGSATIVVYNGAGLNAADQQISKTLCDWLSSDKAPQVITGVTSVFTSDALRAALQSSDGTTQLINVDLAESSASGPAHEAVDVIRTFIAGLPQGPTILVTGNAGISTDALASIHDTINKATLVTVVLVVILLLIIYRSPIAMLVPLVTITISYLIARSIAGFMAGAGVNVSSLVDAYLVVTLFGVGTDYCLFMVSRFKEDIVGLDGRAAVSATLRHIGPVILASASMVIVALLCLGISRFGMNRTSGFVLAIGVAVTLLAGLTLTPSLISVFGRNLLWPGKLFKEKKVKPGFWQRLGGQITRRPVVFVVPIIIILLLPYLALNKLTYSAALINQMPDKMDSVKGYNIFKTHFASGKYNPSVLVVESQSGVLTDASGINKIKIAAEKLKSIPGVNGVVYFAAPADQMQTLSNQISALAAALSPTTLNQLSSLQSSGQLLQNLAIQYPGLPLSSQFQDAIQKLGTINTSAALAAGVSSPQAVAAAIAQLQSALQGLAADLSSLASQFNLQSSGALADWLKNNYFSADGKAARLDLNLKGDPYARDTVDSIPLIREGVSQAFKAGGWEGLDIYLGGAAADQADIIGVNDSDFVHVLLLAVAGILLVSILLLRSLLAPLYMILTVLFNFGATMGIAAWLFIDVLGQTNLIYMLPIFVFVILVAVGSDYNIFLVSRIREEAHKQPLKEAITTAVANTGGVITSCGVILAGTFATLTTASLQMVFQVGAAIAVGVLIDTFLVRAVLIPSLAALAGRWNWWPSALFRK
jgi:putative drug exporter of the RND superfamily